MPTQDIDAPVSYFTSIVSFFNSVVSFWYYLCAAVVASQKAIDRFVSFFNWEKGDLLSKIIKEDVNGIRGFLESETRVILNKKNIGISGTIALSKGLKQNSTVQELRLVGCRIGDHGAIEIANRLPTNLEQLWLGANDIGPLGIDVLGIRIQKHSALRKLTLVKNRIGDRGASILGRMLPQMQLEYLQLDGNLIFQEGAIALGRGLTRNRTLRVVSLTDNRIGEEGAMVLFASLPHNILEKLCIDPHCTPTRYRGRSISYVRNRFQRLLDERRNSIQTTNRNNNTLVTSSPNVPIVEISEESDSEDMNTNSPPPSIPGSPLREERLSHWEEVEETKEEKEGEEELANLDERAEQESAIRKMDLYYTLFVKEHQKLVESMQRGMQAALENPKRFLPAPMVDSIEDKEDL